MTALQAMLELLPPSRWDTQWWICLWPSELHGGWWKGRKSLALFNPCSQFRFSSAASCDEEGLQNLSAVLPAGCCIQRLGLIVESLAVVLLSCWSQAFEFQFLLWFQWWDLCFGVAVTSCSSNHLNLGLSRIHCVFWHLQVWRDTSLISVFW